MPGGDGPWADQPSAAELTGELPRFLAERPDVDGADAAETVEALVDLGVPPDDAAEAVRDSRVPLVLLQQVIGGPPARHDLATLAERSGVPAELLRRVRMATGLSVPDAFTDDDVEWAQRLARLLEVLPAEAVIRSARARGSALSAIATSDLATIRDHLVLPMRRAGADDLTVAVALAEASTELRPLAEALLLSTYELALKEVLGSEMAAIAARSTQQDVELAVGFVDVVGYTALSSRIDPKGLDEVLDAFERRVVEVVARDPDVGVVKYLGDAVMLVGPDAVTLARTMIELTTEHDELAESPLRGGLAFGSVLVREGDYYGDPVNLAARLTDIARPWSLLADEHLLATLEDEFDVRRILPTRIRGVGLRRPVVVRPPV